MNNPQSQANIREAYKRCGGNINLVARELGISPSEIRAAFPTTAVVVRHFPDEGPRPQRDARGLLAVGRENLRPFIISVRHAYAAWPEEDRNVLQRARQSYDAGTHLMVQGRDGPWIIQYAWKRNRAVTPFTYFYGGF